MCTKFSNKLSLETVEAVFAALSDLARPPPPPCGGFALGEQVAVVRAGEPRMLTARRWGWAAPDGRLLANARSETVASKPYFRRHADARRCVVPADGFFEFQGRAGERQPWFFTLASAPVFGLAGIANEDGDVVVLTTEPNARVRPVHRRMPVILRADLLSGWLNPARPFHSLPPELFAPWPADDTRAAPPPLEGPHQPELL